MSQPAGDSGARMPSSQLRMAFYAFMFAASELRNLALPRTPGLARPSLSAPLPKGWLSGLPSLASAGSWRFSSSIPRAPMSMHRISLMRAPVAQAFLSAADQLCRSFAAVQSTAAHKPATQASCTWRRLHSAHLWRVQSPAGCLQMRQARRRCTVTGDRQLGSP